MDPGLLEIPKHVPPSEVQSTPSIDLGTSLGRDGAWLPLETEPFGDDEETCLICGFCTYSRKEGDITRVV